MTHALAPFESISIARIYACCAALGCDRKYAFPSAAQYTAFPTLSWSAFFRNSIDFSFAAVVSTVGSTFVDHACSATAKSYQAPDADAWLSDSWHRYAWMEITAACSPLNGSASSNEGGGTILAICSAVSWGGMKFTA